MKETNSLYSTLALALLLFAGLNAHADHSRRVAPPPKPLALVWKGPGACKPDCVTGAANIAKKAGFRVQYLSSVPEDFSIFADAKLWMQPGGVSTDAAGAMGPALLNRIREFVADGGGYVGFCAGGFISTQQIGESEANGLGLVPGDTELYVKEGSDHKMFLIDLGNGKTRWLYYAGGPFFKITDSQLQSVQGEIMGRYPDGSIAGIKAHYGKGKVAVIGLHPEAGWFWKFLHGKIDRDGNDYDIAVDMVNYATSP